MLSWTEVRKKNFFTKLEISFCYKQIAVQTRFQAAILCVQLWCRSGATQLFFAFQEYCTTTLFFYHLGPNHIAYNICSYSSNISKVQFVVPEKKIFIIVSDTFNVSFFSAKSNTYKPVYSWVISIKWLWNLIHEIMGCLSWLLLIEVCSDFIQDHWCLRRYWVSSCLHFQYKNSGIKLLWQSSILGTTTTSNRRYNFDLFISILNFLLLQTLPSWVSVDGVQPTPLTALSRLQNKSWSRVE